jgi:hypothetical protein
LERPTGLGSLVFLRPGLHIVLRSTPALQGWDCRRRRGRCRRGSQLVERSGRRNVFRRHGRHPGGNRERSGGVASLPVLIDLCCLSGLRWHTGAGSLRCCACLAWSAVR